MATAAAATKAPTRPRRNANAPDFPTLLVKAAAIVLGAVILLPLVPGAWLVLWATDQLCARYALHGWRRRGILALPALTLLGLGYGWLLLRGPAPDAWAGHVQTFATTAQGQLEGWLVATVQAAKDTGALPLPTSLETWRPFLSYLLLWMGVGGPLVGVFAAPFGPFTFPKSEDGIPRSPLVLRDAKVLAREKATAVQWGAQGLVGRGVLTLVSAAPKVGKSWWMFSLLRAMQDGAPFFGLPTRSLRVLYCTEEGQSFNGLVRQFGIGPETLVAIRRQEVRGWDWPSLLAALRAAAWQHRCALVVLDTLGAWCPTAEQGPEPAAAAMEPVRDLTASGLGVVILHHDRKAGGKDGTGVRGSNALVASVDVLIEVGRVANQRTQRRLSILGRYGEALPADELVGRLDGVRYLPIVAEQPAVRGPAVVGEVPSLPVPAAQEPSPPLAPATPLSPPLRETMAYLRGAGPQTTAQIRAGLKIALGTASRRLNLLEQQGLISRTNRDRPGLPQTWTCTTPPQKEGAHGT